MQHRLLAQKNRGVRLHAPVFLRQKAVLHTGSTAFFKENASPQSVS